MKENFFSISVYFDALMLFLNSNWFLFFSVDVKDERQKDEEDLNQTFPDLEQRLQVYWKNIVVMLKCRHLHCGFFNSWNSTNRKSIEIIYTILFFLFLCTPFCFLPDIFFLFFPTAGAALCVSEGECPGVQGALQDGEGVPQGWVWDRRPRGAKVSPC